MSSHRGCHQRVVLSYSGTGRQGGGDSTAAVVVGESGGKPVESGGKPELARAARTDRRCGVGLLAFVAELWMGRPAVYCSGR